MAMAQSLEETGTYEPLFCSTLLAKKVIRLQEIGLHWLSLIKTVKRDWQARQTLVSWAQQETSCTAKLLNWFQMLIAKSELAFDSSPSSEQVMAWVWRWRQVADCPLTALFGKPALSWCQPEWQPLVSSSEQDLYTGGRIPKCSFANLVGQQGFTVMLFLGKEDTRKDVGQACTDSNFLFVINFFIVVAQRNLSQEN